MQLGGEERLRKEATAALLQARREYRRTQQEWQQLRSSHAAFLSLHCPSAGQDVFSAVLKLPWRGQKSRSVRVQVHQSPEKGVGGVVWQSSVVLAEALESLLNETQFSLEVGKVEGELKRIEGGKGPLLVELGAGVSALPSLAAASYLSSTPLQKIPTVIATDLAVNVDRLQENIDRNLSAMELDGQSLSVASCVWGEEIEGVCDKKVDVILGADIIYTERVFTDLVSTISRYLRQNGLLLLSFAQRNIDAENNFFDLLAKGAGIVCQVHSEQEWNGTNIVVVMGRKASCEETTCTNELQIESRGIYI